MAAQHSLTLWIYRCTFSAIKWRSALSFVVCSFLQIVCVTEDHSPLSKHSEAPLYLCMAFSYRQLLVRDKCCNENIQPNWPWHLCFTIIFVFVVIPPLQAALVKAERGWKSWSSLLWEMPLCVCFGCVCDWRGAPNSQHPNSIKIKETKDSSFTVKATMKTERTL